MSTGPVSAGPVSAGVVSTRGAVSGAGVGSSLLTMAHESMLGVDWHPSEYVVLRGDREVETEAGIDSLVTKTRKA